LALEHWQRFVQRVAIAVIESQRGEGRAFAFDEPAARLIERHELEASRLTTFNARSRNCGVISSARFGAYWVAGRSGRTRWNVRMTPPPRAAARVARCKPLARNPAKPALMIAFLIVMVCRGGP